MKPTTLAVQTPQQIAVTSQLMQNYRTAIPFVAAGAITTAFNGSSQLTEIFSVGSNGNLSNIYPDSGSDTGWSIIDMAFPGKVKTFDTCSHPNGSIVMYAADTNGVLYVNTKTEANWGGWQGPDLTLAPATVAITSGNLQHYGFSTASLIEIKVRFFFEEEVHLPGPPVGTINLFASFTVTDTGGNSTETCWLYDYDPTAPNNDTPWKCADAASATINWCPALIPSPDSITGTGNGAYVVGNSETLKVSGNDDGISGDGNGTDIESWVPSDNVPYVRQLTGSPFRNLAVVEGPFTNQIHDELFAMQTNNGSFSVFQMHCDGVETKPQGTLPGSFDNVLLSGTQPISSFAVRLAQPQRMELIAINTANYLWYTSQDGSNAGTWTDFIQINDNLQFAQVITGANMNLYSESFAVTTDNKLIHVWQGSADDDWNFDEIEVGGDTGTVEEMNTYTLQLTVFDSNQVAVPNATVEIFSKSPVMLEVNGVMCVVKPGNSWNCVSNPLGHVNIIMETTSLGVPELAAGLSFLSQDDNPIPIDPSGAIRSTLTGIDANQLLAAQVTDDSGNQSPLLTGNATTAASDLANAINASMNLAAAIPGSLGQSNSSRYFHRLNDNSVAGYKLMSKVQKDPLTAGKESGWRVDFTSTGPVFSALSPEQASSAMAATLALPQLSTLTDIDLSWGSFFDLIESGIESIGEGVGQLTSWIVQGVKVGFQIVVNGITYVYHGVVAFIEQAFDLLEEVFRQVGVLFDQLFRWLGKVIGWDGVLRTKDAIKTGVTSMIGFAELLVPVIESMITGKIEAFQQTISKTFADLITLLGTNTSLAGNLQRADNVQPDVQRDFHVACSMNIFQSAMVNNSSKMPVTISASKMVLTAEASAAIDNVIGQLRAMGQQFQSAQAFNDALTYFSQIYADPEHFLQLAISGLLSVIEGIALLILDAAIALVQLLAAAASAALEAVQLALNASLPEIPFLSALYRRFSGELTPLDLLAVTIAMPATFFYRLRYDADPFPDEASLQSFQAYYSAESIWQRSGLTGSTKAAGAVAPVVLRAEDMVAFDRAFTICNAVTSVVFGVADVMLDAQIAVGFFSWVAFGGGWLGWFFGTPRFDSETPVRPGCGDNKQFNSLHWCLQSIPNLVGSIWFAAEDKLPRSSANAGPILSSCMSAADLILTITGVVWDSNAGELDVFGAFASVFSSIPALAKFLGADVVIEASEGTSVILLLFLDAAFDLSAAVFNIVDAATSGANQA